MKRISTFEQLLDQYILERPLSEATIRTYKGVINGFIKDTSINKLKDVSFEPLLDWRLLVTLRSSDITWNNYLRHMRALWKFAILKHYVPEIDHFKNLHWGKYNTSKTKTITRTQLKKTLFHLSNKHCNMEPCWFWKMVVSFMYFTGVRRKQLVTIYWKDINLEEMTLVLSAQGEKTDIERTIPLVEAVASELEKYRRRIIKDYPQLYSDEKQLFNITALNPRYSGNRMNETQLSGFFKRLSKQIGFPISSHRLRHTMATEIAKTGRIKPLQKILGHTNIGTTMNFYVHPDIDELRKAADCLGDI